MATALRGRLLIRPKNTIPLFFAVPSLKIVQSAEYFSTPVFFLGVFASLREFFLSLVAALPR
jgi:hypothetical protein